MDAHRFSPRFWSVLALTFLVAIVAQLAQQSPARAQDANPEVLNKVTKLNKKAIDAYQKKDFETARNVLKEALELCANQGLDKHPIKARTHIHLGIVMIGGFKQRESGIKHFKKALQIQPDIQLTKSISNPALQDAFEEAMVGQGGGGGADEPGGGNPAQSDNDQGGGAGASASASGGRDSADGDESPAPRRKAAPVKKKKRRHDDDADGDSDGDSGGSASASASSRKRAKSDDDDDDDDDDHPGSNNAGRIFVGVTGGTGFGIASGTGEMKSSMAHVLENAGFAPAQVAQISPEFGYFVSSNLLLSLQGRYQIITGINPGATTCPGGNCGEKTSAIAVFARATYLLLDGDFHLFIGGSVGGGAIRHVINFPKDTTCGTGSNQTCVDTLQAGPFLVGPNAGIMFDLGKTATLIGGLNTQLGVPKFTFNIDLSLGFGLRF